MTRHCPFKYFKTSKEIIRLAVMMYVRYPLSLRNVEDLLHERGIDVSHESVRSWWPGLARSFAASDRCDIWVLSVILSFDRRARRPRLALRRMR